MSQVIIAGDVSGTVTLQAPSTAGSTVLNLPSTSGYVQAPATVGTSGQFLTSAGGGAPTWSAAPASAMTLISTLTANNTATSLSWSGLSGYDKYMLIIENLLSHGSSIDQYFIYFGTGSGPTYATSGYTRSVMYFDGTSTINGQANGLSSSQSGIIICALGNYSSSQTYPYGLSGSLTISGITSNSPRLEGTLSYPNSGGNYWANDCIGGANFSISSSSTPVTAIKIASSTPVNLQSGSVSLYGISS